MKRVAVIVAAAIVAGGCGGETAEQARPTPKQEYIAALKATYPPFRDALLATVEPCSTTKDWQVCRERNAELITTGRVLLDKLATTRVPTTLREANATLRNGVEARVVLVKDLNACIAAGKECLSFNVCCHSSGADINNAIGEVNAAVPTAKLPPPR